MNVKTLNETKAGDMVEVVEINNSLAHLQALRFGINPGAIITTITHITNGPVVINLGYQEIAIGANLAKSIVVKEVN